jgi:peroxiredoxin
MSVNISIAKLLSLLLFCQSVLSQSTYIIKGEVIGAKDSTKVYLDKNTISDSDGTDSTFIIKEQFLFKGESANPIECIITIESNIGENYEIICWIENSIIKITGTNENFHKAKISGSKSQLDYEKYVAEVSNERHKLNADYYDSSSSLLTKKFIKRHTGSYKSVQELYLFRQIFPFLEVRELYLKLVPEIQESKYGKHLRTFLESYKDLKVGDVAPNFKLPNINGIQKSLNNYRGKYILLIFWGSWCPPCRLNNKEYNKIFKTLDSSKLAIVGIALDNESDLTFAINKDEIKWENLIISNSYDKPLLYEYGVASVPANFLIDPNGKIKALELTPYSNSNIIGSLNSLLIALGLMADN